MELDKPRNEVLFAKDGTLNLTGLFKLPASEAKPEEPPSDPFPLRIGSIKLIDGYLHFEDLRPSEPIEFLYDNMNLELKNLSTLPNDNADMTLVASGPNGGRIDWKGTLSLSPIASEGTLKVTDGKMKLFWPYVRDAVPLVLEDGVVSLDTHYKLNLAKQTELLLDNVSVRIAPFAIKAPDGRPLARLASLEVSETTIDLVKQQVTVGKVRSEKLETWAALEKMASSTGRSCSPANPPRPRRRKRPSRRPQHLRLKRKRSTSQANPGKCCSRTCSCATTWYTWQIAARRHR